MCWMEEGWVGRRWINVVLDDSYRYTLRLIYVPVNSFSTTNNDRTLYTEAELAFLSLTTRQYPPNAVSYNRAQTYFVNKECFPAHCLPYTALLFLTFGFLPNDCSKASTSDTLETPSHTHTSKDCVVCTLTLKKQ